MIEKDPDDSVHAEQSGAEGNAIGTEETTHAEKADEKEDTKNEIEKEEESTEGVIKKVRRRSRKASKAESENEEVKEESVQNLDDVVLPPVDYSGYTKNELVETLALIIENRPPAEIRNDIDRIKALFYKKLKIESDERKNKFLSEGGRVEEYRAWVDPSEARVKHLLEKYKERKSDYNRVQDAEKFENLKKKYDIIDKIKELVNREESINKTFHEFRLLQNEWHSTGIVPQNALKDLWENYHHNVEIFYDYININKELRDLDLRKNLELKIALCEKAEELLLEPNPVNAFRALQDFHNQWREIGPVPQESKNEIWERFKEATSQINKRHHEYFEKQKDGQRKNLEAKMTLCEEVEAINALEIKNFRDFDEKAEKIVSLQKMWRTIGFAPKKQNNKVYQRFREACDIFFEKKRTFYTDNKETQLNNLQLKAELCIQAESLQESTDWKSTSDALIRLQREWKEIGPVPRKQSEKTWKRFRKACDHFFNKKADFFAHLDTSDEDKSILKYRTKLDNMKANPKASRKVRNERDKFFTKMKQLESDIVLWENNIGFFAKSPNADTMIKEVQEKIENAKKMIKTLEEKVKMIDQSGF